MSRVSAKAIMAKFSRKFKPDNQGWSGIGLEWIGEALGIMDFNDNCYLAKKELEVHDHKAKIPCDVSNIGEILYNCCYLPIRRPTRLKTCKQHTSAYGTINGCYLNTSFKEGKVDVFYYDVMKGEDGFPIVPRDPQLFEAVSWYMLREYLGQGNTHPVFSWRDADAMWEKHYPRARNRVDFPKLVNQEAFSTMWVNLVPNIMSHYDGFVNMNGVVDGYDGDITSFSEPRL